MRRKNIQSVAAYLAHPFLDMPSETQDFSSYETKSIYDFLRRNRVILRAMNLVSAEESNFSGKNNFLKEIVTSSQLFVQAHDFALYQRERCLKLVKAMTEGGIDIIFIKSSNEFPLDSHNFDVLSARDSRIVYLEHTKNKDAPEPCNCYLYVEG